MARPRMGTQPSDGRGWMEEEEEEESGRVGWLARGNGISLQVGRWRLTADGESATDRQTQNKKDSAGAHPMTSRDRLASIMGALVPSET